MGLYISNQMGLVLKTGERLKGHDFGVYCYLHGNVDTGNDV